MLLLSELMSVLFQGKSAPAGSFISIDMGCERLHHCMFKIGQEMRFESKVGSYTKAKGDLSLFGREDCLRSTLDWRIEMTRPAAVPEQ